MLPRFELVGRRRPVELVVPGSAGPFLAPYVAVTARITGPATAELTSGDVTLTGSYDGTGAELVTTVRGRSSTHRSRRHGKPDRPVRELGLALTGTHLSVLTRGRG